MTDALLKRDLTNAGWEDESFLRNVIERGRFDKNRKYCFEKFVLSDVIHKFGQASYIRAYFNGKALALKVFSAKEPYSLPWKEVEFLRHLVHDRVITFHGAFRSMASFLVLDLCCGKMFCIYKL